MHCSVHKIIIVKLRHHCVTVTSMLLSVVKDMYPNTDNASYTVNRDVYTQSNCLCKMSTTPPYDLHWYFST